MTDKQIIIDSVDVSGCEYFSSGLGYCTIGLLANDGTHICECEQNCYYKQLKRKEQECKNNEIAYKNELEIFNQECINIQQQLIEALDELDQLKAKNEELKQKKKENENFYLIKYANKDSECLELQSKCNKYKQALDEIEKSTKEICDGCNCVDSTQYTSPCQSCANYEIFDIINKAKDGE